MNVIELQSYYSTENGRLINDDCLNTFKSIEDKSINLIVIDPPYNIGKDKWDKWKSVDEYVQFMGKVFIECERVLTDNGSFYFFHNDFEQMSELQYWIKRGTKFKFKQMIVWDKYNGSDWNQLNAIVHSQQNRNYSKQAEYCLFYTFQDEDWLSKVLHSTKGYFMPIKHYLRDERKRAGLTRGQVKEVCGFGHSKGSTMIGHYFDDSQWQLPIEDHYIKLQTTGFWEKPYKELKDEYENLREGYEKQRYTFNNQGLPSVWQHGTVKQNGHLTPKPLEMIKNVILHSSDENDTVLDCFGGSGTMAVACEELNRKWICIEKEEKYCKLTVDRLKEIQYT